MAVIKSYRDLIAWQKAIVMVQDIYKILETFPSEEKYGLCSQIKRSAVSVPSNIAEGWGRQTNKNNLQFLRTSRGSLMELQTLLTISNNLKFISNEEYLIILDKTDEISRILQGLINNISNKIKDDLKSN